MDVDAPDQDLDNECLQKRNRIKMYKSILNYYKGRSVSLDYVLLSKQPHINSLPEVRTYEALAKNIQALHDDITLIQSMKNSLKLINYSLASTELMGTNDINIKRSCLQKIEGIIFFSNSIMKVYKECCTELELINKMRDYSAVLDEYMKSLEKLKESEESEVSEGSQKMEKIKLQIYKINLVRTMKSVLIGYITLNCPDLLRSVHQFKNPFRRDLTIDDFQETWDVGIVYLLLARQKRNRS